MKECCGIKSKKKCVIFIIVFSLLFVGLLFIVLYFVGVFSSKKTSSELDDVEKFDKFENDIRNKISVKSEELIKNDSTAEVIDNDDINKISVKSEEIKEDSSPTVKTLNYKLNKYNYTIIGFNQTYLIISEKKGIKCFKAPCRATDTIIITNNEEIQILESLFKQIFNQPKDEYKIVKDGDLTVEQNDKIIIVLENNNIISKNERKYEIIKDSNDFNSMFSQRGYSYIIENGYIIYTIAMGEKSTGGYSISIQKVKIEENNNVTIYVEETSPGPNSISIQVITYPIAKIKFSIFPENMNVINIKTGVSFPFISDIY